MATKKQKRERMEQKRQEFMDTIRETGMKAQQKDRAHRERKVLEAWQENHDKNHSWKKRIKECPHCTLELQASARMAKQVQA